MINANYHVNLSNLSPADQKELQSEFAEIFKGLSGDVKNELNKEARESFKRICETEWNNQTPALSQTLLQNGFETKSEGTNLDRQIARWKNSHLPYKTVFRLAKALKKPISEFFPSFERFLYSMDNNVAFSTETGKVEGYEDLVMEIARDTHRPEKYLGLSLPKVNNRTLLLLGGACGILILAFLIWQAIYNSPDGQIYFPPREALVSPEVPVNGVTKNIADDHYVWLVVEIGDLWWAKANVPRNTKFRAFVREDGSPVDGRFTLSLFEVDERWHSHFIAWLNGGKLLDKFPGGQKKIPDSNKLDSVPLILQKE